jgi:ankyrin repeat protein
LSRKPTDLRLLEAAHSGDSELIRKLATYVNLEVVEEPASKQAIHIAAEKGNIEILDILLEAGADIEAKDSIAQTPLFYAGLAG